MDFSTGGLLIGGRPKCLLIWGDHLFLNYKKKCNLKTGGPPGLINRWAYPRLINHQCWNPIFYPTFFISNSIYFQLFFYLFFNHHCYTSGLSWSLKISKNNYSPNDRFLIKIFIKIISLDSSQRVPPMSPCPLISTGLPLINQPPFWSMKF